MVLISILFLLNSGRDRSSRSEGSLSEGEGEQDSADIGESSLRRDSEARLDSIRAHNSAIKSTEDDAAASRVREEILLVHRDLDLIELGLHRGLEFGVVLVIGRSLLLGEAGLVLVNGAGEHLLHEGDVLLAAGDDHLSLVDNEHGLGDEVLEKGRVLALVSDVGVETGLGLGNKGLGALVLGLQGGETGGVVLVGEGNALLNLGLLLLALEILTDLLLLLTDETLLLDLALLLSLREKLVALLFGFLEDEALHLLDLGLGLLFVHLVNNNNKKKFILCVITLYI